MMAVTVQFAGGLESLFGGAKTLTVTDVPSSGVSTVSDLIVLLQRDFLRERPELFVDCRAGDATSSPTVRPGILVLINDADWELSDGPSTHIAPGDTILFMSTLHGG